MTYIIKIDPKIQKQINAIEALKKFKYWAITDSQGNILQHFVSYAEMYKSFFKDFNGNHELNLSYITKTNEPDALYDVNQAPY